MTDTPISDATPHNVGHLGIPCGKLERELAALHHKVAAAEGLATALARCAKVPVCVYPEGLYIDLEDHAAVIAALAAWKGASE